MRHKIIGAAGWVLVAGLAGLAGCTPKAELEVKPIRIEPIYIKMDVNIRVDNQLNKYLFADDSPAPASQPAQPG